ncbi:hypothetical protein KIS4809_1718 [Bacillus sp. ZZV12-4809]|nr:hypothetical protein KIS4809_1718 [Bacillus sp. ZZV12-4809]
MYEELGKLLTIYTKRYAFFPGIMIHRYSLYPYPQWPVKQKKILLAGRIFLLDICSAEYA